MRACVHDIPYYYRCSSRKTGTTTSKKSSVSENNIDQRKIQTDVRTLSKKGHTNSRQTYHSKSSLACTSNDAAFDLQRSIGTPRVHYQCMHASKISKIEKTGTGYYPYPCRGISLRKKKHNRPSVKRFNSYR